MAAVYRSYSDVQKPYYRLPPITCTTCQYLNLLSTAIALCLLFIMMAQDASLVGAFRALGELIAQLPERVAQHGPLDGVAKFSPIFLYSLLLTFLTTPMLVYALLFVIFALGFWYQLGIWRNQKVAQAGFFSCLGFETREPLFFCDADGIYLLAKKGRHLFVPWNAVGNLMIKKGTRGIWYLNLGISVPDKKVLQKLALFYPPNEDGEWAKPGFVALSIPFHGPGMHFSVGDVRQIHKKYMGGRLNEERSLFSFGR